MNGPGAVPESGVKKGEVGLSGPGEKDDGAVSVNALFNEFVLVEWNGPCRLLKSKKLFGLSFVRLSWLGALCSFVGEGESALRGETGEVPPPVCDVEAEADIASASSGAREPLRERAPIKLFFNLNFSIQLDVNV